MKNTCFEINSDGQFSTIEEVSIYSLLGSLKVVDEICYFSTKAKAKKALLEDFKNTIQDYKIAINRVKNL